MTNKGTFLFKEKKNINLRQQAENISKSQDSVKNLLSQN